jgi:hypothetical protein
LVIDMSRDMSQDDFDHHFEEWKDEVVENPELWRQGWSLENLRLVIRDFSDRYGQQVVFAAHLSNRKGEKH